jgi:hypothetical protein
VYARLPEVAPAADVMGRALDVIASASWRVRAAGARLANRTWLLTDRPPVIPPDVSARIERALAAQAASRAVTVSQPDSRPAGRVHIPQPRDGNQDA